MIQKVTTIVATILLVGYVYFEFSADCATGGAVRRKLEINIAYQEDGGDYCCNLLNHFLLLVLRLK